MTETRPATRCIVPEKIKCDPAKREIVAPSREWLSAEDCAEWLGVSVSTINRLIRDGEFLKPGFCSVEGDDGKPGRPGARRWYWKDFWCWCHLRNIGYAIIRAEVVVASSNQNPGKALQ